MSKLKFTVIDVLIIVALIVGIAAGIIFLKPKGKAAESNGMAEITVLVQNTERGTDKLIKAGDKIKIGDEDVDCSVVNVEETAKKVYEFNKYVEKYILNEDETKADVKVTVRCEANVTDTKISCGKLDVRVGNEMMLSGKGYSIKGYVIGLEDTQEDK